MRIGPTGQSNQLSAVALDRRRVSMPSARVQVDEEPDLLDEQIDSLDVGTIGAWLGVRHPYRQSRRCHKQFGDVELQSAAAETGAAYRAMCVIPDPLAR
jgi:hypothetical protein